MGQDKLNLRRFIKANRASTLIILAVACGESLFTSQKMQLIVITIDLLVKTEIFNSSLPKF